MKKILIVANTVSFLYRFKFELIEKLIEQKYEVFIIAKNENTDDYLKEILKLNVKYFDINMNRRGKNLIEEFLLIKKYYKAIKKIKPDFIYTFTIKCSLYIGIIAQILKRKYAATITGIGSAYKYNFFKFFLNYFYKVSLKNTKIVFFENEENKKYFIENNLISSNKAIIVRGSGVNINKFSPIPKKKNEKIIFLFLGRIMKEKGIEEYLEIAKIFRNKNIEFWIAGIYEEKKYKEIINKLEEEKIVKYFEEVLNVIELIGKTDYVIQPSYHEGLSNVILEASAMEKIVIASNISGCREAIYNKKYLFEVKNIKSLKNVIENVLTNRKEYENDAKAQREFIINNFSRDSVVQANIDILEKR